MKDKEKQIEEIAKEICIKCKDITYCSHEKCTMCYKVAEELISQGYRKPHKDSIVLTDDNAEEIANLIVTSPQMQSVMSDLIEAWQKETAEKIIAMLKQPPYIDFIESWVLDELAKQFGVEIKGE